MSSCCEVVVRLKLKKSLLDAFQTMVSRGVDGSIDDFASTLSRAMAKKLFSSHLRKLLAGNLLQAIRPLFVPKSTSHFEKWAREGIGTVDIPIVFDEEIPDLLRGYLMLRFPTVEEASAAIKRLQLDTFIEIAHIAQSRTFDSDPLASHQWGHQALGKQLDASSVRIAVIDSGVDSTHEDLQGIISPQNYLPGSDSPDDQDGHGTHCIGIIAANGDNGLGVRGVCRPEKILSMKVGDGVTVDPFGYYEALHAALNQEARVISLGLSGLNHDPTEEATLRAAIDKNNAVICVSVGNGGTTEDRYPAALSGSIDGIIAVGALSQAGVATFSNRARYLDLVAPGDQILSTDLASTYAFRSGTSMATPFVAGVAAALIHKNPNLSPGAVRQLLRDRAERLDGQVGRDDAAGFGRLTIPRGDLVDFA